MDAKYQGNRMNVKKEHKNLSQLELIFKIAKLYKHNQITGCQTTIDRSLLSDVVPKPFIFYIAINF